MQTATAKTTDPRARSIALATARGHTVCSWAAHFVAEETDPTTGALLSVTYDIDSAHSDSCYVLKYAAADDATGCACRSAQFAHGCYHRGLAIIKGRALAVQHTPAGRAALEAEARDLQRWADNYLALAPSL